MTLKPDWQKIMPNRQKVTAAWQKFTPQFRRIMRKSLPYVLVAIFASTTTFAVLAAQNSKLTADMEAEKQALNTSKQELENALEETEKLLGQLSTTNQDIQNLIAAADQKESEVSDKINELTNAFDSAEEKERQKWVMPIRYTCCTSPFGTREHPVEGEAKFHYGVDLAAPEGTPIVASRSGTVTVATFEENAGYYVNIDHLDGYVSRYMHMSKYIVTSGQFVMAGQIIGYCGSTGVATGPHLHFGIYRNGEAVNPAEYIDI